MRIAYFDCFSGISGDMFLGALVDAGVDFNLLKRSLEGLPVGGYHLREEKIKRNGISASNIYVDLLERKHPCRNLQDIIEIIDASPLPGAVKEKSKSVFQLLASAEAAVHGTSADHIHFHEVGAVDAIVDIVGTALGIDMLRADKIYASPLPMGRGFIECEHGIIPNPAPATLEILRGGVPVYGTGIEEELVTPTGAALISVFAEAFMEMPAISIERIGYGAGKKVMNHPNLLRLVLGEYGGGWL